MSTSDSLETKSLFVILPYEEDSKKFVFFFNCDMQRVAIIMFILLVLKFVLVQSIQPPRIPLVIDEFGDVHLDAVVDNLYGPVPLRYRLSTFFTSSNRLPESGYPGRGLVEEVSFISPNTSSEITRYNSSFSVGSPSLWENGIAVGSQSQMVEQFSSVDFVNVFGSSDNRVAAFLELGNSYERFTETFCTLGSLFNVTINDAEQTRGFVVGHTDSVLEIEFLRSPPLLGVGRMGHRVVLPGEMYEVIEATIRRHSRRIVHDTFESETNMVFESCAEVRRHLEPIRIQFMDPHNVVSAQGHLVFDPIDFTLPIESLDDTCELVIGNGGEDETIAIDVFMLNINVRFTRNQITFCDTSV
jgi:hypothetical protein